MEGGLIDKLFARFGQHLEAAGYIAPGGQIIDPTIVSVPKQRNTKEENEARKTPEGWEQRPAKKAQKDKDARWTKKNDASFYGYKNHVGVDKAHKLIRKWDVTNAAVHDSQKLDDVLDLSNTGKEVWADSAYRAFATEARLQEKGLQSRTTTSRPCASPARARAMPSLAAFDAARGDVLLILDADLTMPPQQLPKFWEAIRSASQGRVHQRFAPGLFASALRHARAEKPQMNRQLPGKLPRSRPSERVTLSWIVRALLRPTVPSIRLLKNSKIGRRHAIFESEVPR